MSSIPNITMTQDWILLEPLTKRKSGIVTPMSIDTLAIEKRRDLEAFEVLLVGPWLDVYVGNEWRKHGIEKGDIVLIEGINFGTQVMNSKRYALSRAGHVIYKYTIPPDDLVSINQEGE